MDRGVDLVVIQPIDGLILQGSVNNDTGEVSPKHPDHSFCTLDNDQLALGLEPGETLGEHYDVPDPLIARLPREPGKREQRYAHLFSGTIVHADADAPVAVIAAPPTAGLEGRVSALEEELAALQQRLAALERSQ